MRASVGSILSNMSVICIKPIKTRKDWFVKSWLNYHSLAVDHLGNRNKIFTAEKKWWQDEGKRSMFWKCDISVERILSVHSAWTLLVPSQAPHRICIYLPQGCRRSTYLLTFRMIPQHSRSSLHVFEHLLSSIMATRRGGEQRAAGGVHAHHIHIHILQRRQGESKRKWILLVAPSHLNDVWDWNHWRDILHLGTWDSVGILFYTAQAELVVQQHLRHYCEWMMNVHLHLFGYDCWVAFCIGIMFKPVG